LRRSCMIKSINSRGFESIRVRSSLLSHLVPLSWTGVKYPNVREQGRSSTYAPHLNPTERLWGVMHKWVTHNRHYATFK
jgi:hypothetical protein